MLPWNATLSDQPDRRFSTARSDSLVISKYSEPLYKTPAQSSILSVGKFDRGLHLAVRLDKDS